MPKNLLQINIDFNKSSSTKSFWIFTLFLLFNFSYLYAQTTEKVVSVNTINYKGEEKQVEGKCFVLSFVKTKNLYQVILIDKKDILESKEFKIFLKQEQKKEPYIFTISTESKYLIKTEKLIAIPFFVIREELKKNTNSIIYPAFTLEDFIPEMMIGITEKDVENLKSSMEKSLKK